MEYEKSVMKRGDDGIIVVEAPPLLNRGEIDDVVVIRSEIDCARCTNIRWVLGRWHSCAGFEWGYVGQGPRDFARNILMHFTEDSEFSVKYENEFAVRFIADLPRDQGYIKKEDILKFIAAKRGVGQS
jgi:hypothetical protein